MKKILFALSALALLPAMSFALPPENGDGTGGGGTITGNPGQPATPRPIPEALKAWDTNNDGVLSHEEIKAGREAARVAFVAKWDANKDGKLDRDELKAAFEAWKAEHPKPVDPPTTGGENHPPRPPKPRPPHRPKPPVLPPATPAGPAA